MFILFLLVSSLCILSSSSSSPAALEKGLCDVGPACPMLRKLGSVGEVTSNSSSSDIFAKDEADPGAKGFVPGKLELEAILPAGKIRVSGLLLRFDVVACPQWTVEVVGRKGFEGWLVVLRDLFLVDRLIEGYTVLAHTLDEGLRGGWTRDWKKCAEKRRKRKEKKLTRDKT